MLDILQPAVSLMIRAQTVNLPPWKIIAWHSRVIALLETSQEELTKVKNGSQPSKTILPKLSKHWQEINAGRLSDDEDEHEPGTFQVFCHYTDRVYHKYFQYNHIYIIRHNMR